MNLARLRRWVPTFGRQQKSASVATSLDLFMELFGRRESAAGKIVGIDDALRCATALACARVIANGIAQVPFKLFREDSSGRKRPARDHALYDVLHRRPNAWQTSYEFRETLGFHLIFSGRAYAYKTLVAGSTRELWPISPEKVRVALGADGVTRRYFVRSDERGEEREYPAETIWHLRGPSWNGWEAMDALDLAREVLGLTIAAEEQHARLHKNGIKTSGAYAVDGTLTDKQHKDLLSFLVSTYSGSGNAGMPLILDRGAKWLNTTMSGRDAQHLETRRFQVEEVCRAMGVMPMMVFSYENAASYASTEAFKDIHATHTLAPWWERIEQSADANLLTKRDAASGHYAKFVSAGLLRGSMKDRAEYYAKALGAGGSPPWMSQDEVRDLEDLDLMGGAAAKLPPISGTTAPVAVGGEE